MMIDLIQLNLHCRPKSCKKANLIMAQIDNFMMSNAGWRLVHHFLLRGLAVIPPTLKQKHPDWETRVSCFKEDLISRLEKIEKRMTNNGHAKDAEDVWVISQLVKATDLTNPINIRAIISREQELNPIFGPTLAN